MNGDQTTVDPVRQINALKASRYPPTKAKSKAKSKARSKAKSKALVRQRPLAGKPFGGPTHLLI
jgi:hypothetical protein